MQANQQPKNTNHPNLFRYILKNNMPGMEQIFVSHSGYDKVQLIVDYICEG